MVYDFKADLDGSSTLGRFADKCVVDYTTFPYPNRTAIVVIKARNGSVFVYCVDEEVIEKLPPHKDLVVELDE